MENIGKLPMEVILDGPTHYQFMRGTNSCIYYADVTEGIRLWEVFRIMVYPLNGSYEKFATCDVEIFPREENFGDWAWIFKSREMALGKYLELEKEKKNDPLYSPKF